MSKIKKFSKIQASKKLKIQNMIYHSLMKMNNKIQAYKIKMNESNFE